MLLRHLIVLIIDVRNLPRRSCNRRLGHWTLNDTNRVSQRGVFLIGQIKLTRIHVLELFLPGVRVKRTVEASLYDVERSGSASPEGDELPNLLSVCDVVLG